MTHEDSVFEQLVAANPIPAIGDLDLVDVGGPEYLAILEKRGSEVTHTDTRLATPANATRRKLILGLAASIAVVLASLALLVVATNNDPVVATTDIAPGEHVELQGQGSRSSTSFQLGGGSYSVETSVSGDCSYTFDLSRSGTGHMVERITSMREPGTTTVTIDDVRPNSYFVSVNTDSEFSCPWSMSFTRS